MISKFKKETLYFLTLNAFCLLLNSLLNLSIYKYYIIYL